MNYYITEEQYSFHRRPTPQQQTSNQKEILLAALLIELETQ